MPLFLRQSKRAKSGKCGHVSENVKADEVPQLITNQFDSDLSDEAAENNETQYTSFSDVAHNRDSTINRKYRSRNDSNRISLRGSLPRLPYFNSSRMPKLK